MLKLSIATTVLCSWVAMPHARNQAEVDSHHSRVSESFHSAVNFLKDVPQIFKTPNETELMLYALKQQATVGPCTVENAGAQPYAVQFAERAKWDAWNELGDMSRASAMVEYLKLMGHLTAAWASEKSHHAKDNAQDSANAWITQLQDKAAELKTFLTDKSSTLADDAEGAAHEVKKNAKLAANKAAKVASEKARDLSDKAQAAKDAALDKAADVAAKAADVAAKAKSAATDAKVKAQEQASNLADSARDAVHPHHATISDRFHSTIAYLKELPSYFKTPDETELKLYALKQQATVGPCTKNNAGAQPYAVQFAERAKWNAWNELGEMSRTSAMIEYLKLVGHMSASWAGDKSHHAKDTAQETVNSWMSQLKEKATEINTFLQDKSSSLSHDAEGVVNDVQKNAKLAADKAAKVASEKAHDLADKANAVKDAASAKAADVAAKAKSAATDAKVKAQEQASNLADSAREAVHPHHATISDRFHSTMAYLKELPSYFKTPDETELKLYALKQQATVGPCNKENAGAQPYAVQFAERAKWDAWNELGDMSRTSAMIEYLKLVGHMSASWAGDKSHHAKDTAQETVNSWMAQLKDKATEINTFLQDKSSTVVDDVRDAAHAEACKLSGVAHDVKEAAACKAAELGRKAKSAMHSAEL